ncbi:PPK2 family polyphosphate kinase [Caballeronia sp. BR00000012568055]|uniref:PPK2 family polyphosphate kinase n=1 Tax=Caballeronia sp. BR00000012568055 TaxID=2918761 RepID=UPI0023F9ED1B|nr:PPK2 family polyphosphate kinase [Caballeronia sp. BR00000012568055]
MSKKPELDDFRVPFFDGGKKLKPYDLSAIDPSSKPFSSGSKDADRERLSAIGAQLDDLQEKLHAQRNKRVLLVLQGMDTSGKDGTVRAVFHDVDPLGLRIVPFKAPSEREASHDFLWRVHAQAPMAGEFAIFNRSHYEDVLVPRVLKLINDDECERRYRHIREFESLLADSGTTIVKCFLHISKDEQRARLQARIDDPTKHWKFDVSDIEARKQWDDYQQAYMNLLGVTSTDYAPWYIIPGDSKTHRNVMIAELVLRTMQGMKLDFPPAKESLKGVKVE